MKLKAVLYNVITPFIGLIAFVAVWSILAANIGISIIMPTPYECLSRLVELLGDTAFYNAVANTLIRTLICFGLAFAAALILAVASSKVRIFSKLISPLVTIMRVVPTISVILLVLIWLRSDTAPILITFIVIFPMLYTAMLDSMLRVDNNLLEMAKVYKVNFGKQLTGLYIPQILPGIFTSSRITLSFTLKLMVAAEVLAYTRESMGRFMYQANAYIDTSLVIAWTITAVVLGYLLELSVALLERICLRYKSV